MGKKDIAWGYLSQLFNIGSGVILLPIVVTSLSKEHIGLWYVFTALLGLAQLLEFGFLPTLTRQASYVYSGATELKAEGLPERGNSNVNVKILTELISASRKIYRDIALLAAAALMLGGSIYVYSLIGFRDEFNVYIAWFLYVISTLINFYYGYYNGLLRGRGDVTVVNKVIVISRFVMIGISVPVLLWGGGLIGLAVSSFVACIVNRVLISFYFNKDPISKTAKNQASEKSLVQLLWKSSWKLGIVQVGAFLIQRGNMFLAASYLGLQEAANFGLTMQVIILLNSISTQLLNLYLPKMNSLQSKNNKIEVRNLFSMVVFSSWAIFLTGSCFLVFLGNPILNFIGSKASFVDPIILALYCLVMLLELNHSISATYITTLNKVPFLNASLISGISVFILSILLVMNMDNGVLALIVGQGVVQLCFNNWYWPKYAMHDLELNISNLVKYGFSSLVRTFKS